MNRKLNYNHSKRKNDSKILKIIFIITLIYLVFTIIKINNKQEYNTAITQQEKEIEKEEQMKAEVDVAKKVLEARTDKAQRLVNEISNEIEFITMTESGSNSVSHSRQSGDAGWLTKKLKDSKISIKFDYDAIFSIQSSDVEMYVSNGIAYINYDLNDILVKSIEISNAIAETDRSLFGKKYSNQETLSIVEIAKERLYDELNSENNKQQSSDNLNDYFKDMATKIGLNDLIVNGNTIIRNQTYNFSYNEIQYNHGNKPLNDVEYIVIHSTAVKDKTAFEFYNTYNSMELERKANAHFFVDDSNIVQMLPTNIQSWACGCDNPKINCTNANSINIEICEFEDKERQQQAIENTSNFVKEVIMKEFPNAKIVKHRDIKATDCPSILTDEEFEEYFK